MEIRRENDAFHLILDPEEARLLKVALDRATFVDTRPEDQEGAYRLADTLATLLSRKL